MNKFSAASYFETTTTASNMSDESDEENQLEIEEVNMDKLDSDVVNPHFAINHHKIKQSQQIQSTKQPATRQQHYQTNAMQLDGDEYEVMSAGDDDEDRERDYEIIDPDDDDQNELNQNHLHHIQQSLAAAAISSLSNPNQVQDASIVQSLATQVAAAMAAVMAAQQLMTSAASICGLDMTSLSNFATSQAQQQSPIRQNGPQTPEQLMAAAVAATSFLQNNQNANSRNPSNPNPTPPTPASATIPPSTVATTTTPATTTTIVPEDLTISQQQQQSLANGLFGVGLSANSGSGRARSSGANSLSQGNSVKIENCSSGRSSLPRSGSAMSAANAFMANTLNEQLVAAVQGNIASKMALVAAANGSPIGLNQQQQQQQQSINSATSNYLYHHFGQDAVSQQLSNSILAAAQAAAAAQQQLSNTPNQSDNHRDQLSQQRQQALQLSHLNHLSQIAAAGGPLAGHHQSVGVSHHNHLASPTSNHHLPNHHHHHHNNSNPLAASFANGRSALLNNTSTNSNNNNNNNNTTNNGPGNGNNNNNHNNNHHHNHHHPHHTHSTPTRHLLGHHHHSSIQTQQQLLATKGYNPLAASIGQQTEILTPTHLRKAKLMFFYVRYPSSSTLKECFRDVRFNKNNTAQLVKWFSNFREFYYIQMEKFARDAINDDRIKCKEDIVVNYDHELINQLNNHYNKNRHIELPEVFRQVVEETLRHFFDAIHTKRDQEQSWKKAIYKIIQRMDQEVPDVFKTDAFNEHLE